MLQKNISSATWWSLAVRPWGELWGGDDSGDCDDDDDDDGGDDGMMLMVVMMVIVNVIVVTTYGDLWYSTEEILNFNF